MSALEQAFIDAIDAGEIEGVLIEGRAKAGKRYSKALGNRTLPNGTVKPLLSSDMLFWASATKLLTTIAALQCCESGKLALDNDISSQLGQVKTLGVSTGWDHSKSKPSYQPLQKPLTLRHLLTHSSGLAYEFIDPNIGAWREANPVGKGGIGVEARFTLPLAFQPGDGWMYGNGIDWAGLLVERATDMKLQEYFRKYISTPLGISESDISFSPVKDGLGDRMPDLNPKDPGGLGLSASMGHSVHDDLPGECYGGSGAYGSAEAYITVLESLLLNDGKLLSQARVAEMFRPQLESGAKASLAERFLGHPMAPHFNIGTTGKSPDWGLGGLFVTDENDGSGMGKGTIAWGGGCNTTWFIDPENEICGFVSPQLGIPSDPMKGLELKAVFRKHLKEELGIVT